MIVRLGVLLAVLTAGFAIGCGGGEDSESSESTATPQEALSELRQVRQGLDEALATYQSGDAAKADEQVGDAYLEHFEVVEGPLGKVDHELTEELEDSIREELREKIKAKAPQAEIAAIKREIDAGLDQAEVALR